MIERVETRNLNVVLDRLEDDGLLEDEGALLDGFAEWASTEGKPLYQHQEAALVELASGNHVIAETPTGSGKSVIALAGHFLSLARGGRSYYTAPLKALVSEKFFDLVEQFGAANVGMVTGDVALNAQAPIICCTAEILANQALREGNGLDVDLVVMDEFHFYGDPQRGWAWQVPLLELTNPQFVLLSATLGDTSQIISDLEERTGREVALISNAERPVPLEFDYLVDEMGTVVARLANEGAAPIYIVHFTQADAVRSAVDLSRSLRVSEEAKQQIKAELRGQALGKGFGRQLRELLEKGVAVHHAGMLPRYRRLVERLAQRGLLLAICGTDTLGVGINVPIRTVLFTSLVKYDGQRMRHLSAREFHQIAGRAGRPGFDEVGFVKALGSPSEIETLNRRAKMSAAKEAGDKKKQKKVAKKGGGTKKQGELSWTKATFERLTNAKPEPLQPKFQSSHAAFLNVLQGPGDPEARILRLAEEATHGRGGGEKSNRFLREFGDIYRSLLQAGLIRRVPPAERGESGAAIEAIGDLPDDFALNQPLAPFALAALDLLDPNAPDFTMDVISVIESVMEDPRPLLYAQQAAARDATFHALKREGVDYEERKDILAQVSWPKPLQEILEPAFEVFSATNPWVRGRQPSPKSVVREMVEEGLTFTSLISKYQLQTSEGVVLRYLTDTYKALRQIPPAEFQTEEVGAVTSWLREMLSHVDTSLLVEWEEMMSGAPAPVPAESAVDDGEFAFGSDATGTVDWSVNLSAFRRAIKNYLFSMVELVARDDFEGLAALDPRGPWTARRWESALGVYWDEFDHVVIDQRARAGELFMLRESPSRQELLDACQVDSEDELPSTTAGDYRWWIGQQVILDPEASGAYRLAVLVDVEASQAAHRVIARTVHFGAT